MNTKTREAILAYLKSRPQEEKIAALKRLGLLDEDGTPSEKFCDLVQEGFLPREEE